MLEELTAYKSFGTTEHLAEIARSISNGPCTVNDLFVIANNNSTVDIPRIPAAIALLQELKLCIEEDDGFAGSELLDALIDGNQPLGNAIGLILLKNMIEQGLLPVARIQYDLKEGCGYLRQRDIPLRCSQMRNYLIDSGILALDKGRILFEPVTSDILQCEVAALEGDMTPEELFEKLEQNKKAGAEAEAFVMEYEGRRLGMPLAKSIRQVSLISVSAGYDIASFESPQSIQHDRFIEVKAVGHNGFYLSANELQIAKKLAGQYYLYLVDLKKKDSEGYCPEIIRHPSAFFAESSDWRVIPESYHITRIF